ncbi:hypothetical protein EJP82_01940 [Paenibacillus anaericanus]|uniref:Uncharacterized protein n=2 Tax=Paenibacillus TaxID=44249 RepID=A0A3S1BSU0_9BACL|nr:hypothetical protein EJP82_01940 [Paenibacillus anaericanus]
MDVQVWIEFLKENWLVIVVALVVLFLILNFVKTVVKWALVLVIAAFIIIYSGLSLKDLSSAVSVVTEQATSIGKDQVLNVMKSRAKDAKFTQNSDGTFIITISNPDVEVTGTIGGDKVKVVSHGISLGEWTVDDTVEAFIQEATRNSK